MRSTFHIPKAEKQYKLVHIWKRKSGQSEDTIKLLPPVKTSRNRRDTPITLSVKEVKCGQVDSKVYLFWGSASWKVLDMKILWFAVLLLGLLVLRSKCHPKYKEGHKRNFLLPSNFTALQHVKTQVSSYSVHKTVDKWKNHAWLTMGVALLTVLFK